MSATQSSTLTEASEPQSPRVAFDGLEIREYPIIMGDNPGGSCGPPLSIDWEHQCEHRLSVNDYEANRPVRRTGTELCIPSFSRSNMLKDCGYSRKEIVQLQKHVNIARRQRQRTIQTLHLQGFYRFWERARRTTWDIATLGVRKRRERSLLEPYLATDEYFPAKKLRESTCTVDSEGTLEDSVMCSDLCV